jgi:hypothetical protein
MSIMMMKMLVVYVMKNATNARPLCFRFAQ